MKILKGSTWPLWLFSRESWKLISRRDCAENLPGLILTVEEGRWEVEPGEKEESTVEEEVWWEGSRGGDWGLWGGRGW